MYGFAKCFEDVCAHVKHVQDHWCSKCVCFCHVYLCMYVVLGGALLHVSHPKNKQLYRHVVLEIVTSFGNFDVSVAPPTGSLHRKCHSPSKLVGWRLWVMRES